MVAAISQDLRRRVVDAYRRGGVSYAEVAEQFAVGKASVSRWLRMERERGTVEPLPHGGGRRRLIGRGEAEVLDRLVVEHPDWTEDEYAKALNAQLGTDFHAGTVGRAVRRLGYGVKKRPLSLPNATDPTSVDDARSTPNTPPPSPLRVWFLWTKRVSTPR
jgi:transposase